jgi:hypothetical protein
MVLTALYLSNDVCFSGLVPLHNACSYGHFEVTELLLKVVDYVSFIMIFSGIQANFTG